MDKQIRKIEKTVAKDKKKEEKQLKALEKGDKKRDKACDLLKELVQKKKEQEEVALRLSRVESLLDFFAVRCNE